MMIYVRWIGFLLFSLLSGGSIYWMMAVRPFLWTEAASLQMATISMIAEHAGRVKALPFYAGDRIPMGEELFALSSEILETKQKEKMLQCEVREAEAKKKRILLDQTMQTYLSVRTDLELGRIGSRAVDEELTRFQTVQLQYDEAQQAVAQAKAELCDIVHSTQRLSQHAPKELLVMRRMKEMGEWVAVGDALYVLADPEHMWIEALIAEEQLGEVTIGAMATIGFTAYPGQVWTGHVCAMGAEVLPGRQIALRIAFEQELPSTLTLRPGLTAQVKIQRAF